VRFTDPATGFSTADVRDGRDHVVQFDTSGNVIWVADGTRVPGYRAQGSYVPAEGLCACWLEVRFGSVAGERRAYLTADYGHDNPGSLIALDLVDGRLAFARTDLFPPGTYTLSGIVTEMTPTGSVPVAGTQIWRGYGTGWQVGKTDSSGFYEIHGLYNRTDEVSVIDPRFQKFNAVLTISEDTRFDVQLVRVPTSMAAPSR
jgi:hypothetical protein